MKGVEMPSWWAPLPTWIIAVCFILFLLFGQNWLGS